MQKNMTGRGTGIRYKVVLFSATRSKKSMQKSLTAKGSEMMVLLTPLAWDPVTRSQESIQKSIRAEGSEMKVSFRLLAKFGPHGGLCHQIPAEYREEYDSRRIGGKGFPRAFG